MFCGIYEVRSREDLSKYLEGSNHMNSTYGWKGSLVRVNLTSGENQRISTTELTERFIGGRGAVSKIYWDEVDQKTDALHPENPLILMTGPLCRNPCDFGKPLVYGREIPLALS